MIYDRIKEICKEKGVSVNYVEKQANLGTGTISKWNESSPTAERLKAVADVLKIKVDKLLES